MLRITQVLNRFWRPYGQGYIIENKEPITAKEEKIGRSQNMKVNPEMLQITQVLNRFFRPCGQSYIIENKESITAKEEKKRGAPKNEGSSGYVNDNKGSEKRHFGVSGNVYENKGA